MESMKIQNLLPQSQLLGVIDKGLKSYENLLSADVLEQNKEYIKLCELITEYQFDNTVCENFDMIQKQYKKFVNSL